MAVDSTKPTILYDHALAIIMSDVLDTLTELSLESAYANSHCSLEILDISPAQKTMKAEAEQSNAEAEIIEFTQLKRAVG